MTSKKKKIPYNVVVKTMDTGGAGYDGGIFITIMGSAGTSGELALWKVKWLREDFAEGKSESASLEVSNQRVGADDFLECRDVTRRVPTWAICTRSNFESTIRTIRGSREW